MKIIISPGFNHFGYINKIHFNNHIYYLNFNYSNNMSYKRKGEAPEKKYQNAEDVFRKESRDEFKKKYPNMEAVIIYFKSII